MKLFLTVALLASANAFQVPPRLASTFRLSSTANGSSAAAPMQEDVGHLEVEAAPASEGWRSERVSLDISKTIYTSSIKTPKDSYVAFAEKGAANAKMPKTKILHQSILGGCYVGFGGLLS